MRSSNSPIKSCVGTPRDNVSEMVSRACNPYGPKKLVPAREQFFGHTGIEKRTGLLRCYISRVENGHTVPAIETLEKLARDLPGAGHGNANGKGIGRRPSEETGRQHREAIGGLFEWFVARPRANRRGNCARRAVPMLGSIERHHGPIY